jgi:hypothetical protein
MHAIISATFYLVLHVLKSYLLSPALNTNIDGTSVKSKLGTNLSTLI